MSICVTGKNWRALSKQYKGGWLIVSAEGWACIYQISFFSMQQVPTPFQRFSSIGWSQRAICHAQGIVVLYTVELFFLPDRFFFVYIFSTLYVFWIHSVGHAHMSWHDRNSSLPSPLKKQGLWIGATNTYHADLPDDSLGLFLSHSGTSCSG